VSCKDYASKATEAIDLTIMDHGGAHLIFECTGEHPLDRPCDLYLTDVDSECEVIEKLHAVLWHIQHRFML
jgi:hypothetical protein